MKWLLVLILGVGAYEDLPYEEFSEDGFSAPTYHDRVVEHRTKLEKRNNQMVQKKIEIVRIKKERELIRKLKEAFRGNLQAVEKIEPEPPAQVPEVEPAPVQIEIVASQEEPKEEPEAARSNKVVAYLGGDLYNTSRKDINFEPSLGSGFNLEGPLAGRLDYVLGIGYSAMRVVNFDRILPYHYDLYYVYNSTDGDNVAYTGFNLRLGGKLHIANSGHMRFFLGGHGVYNRTGLVRESPGYLEGTHPAVGVSGTHWSAFGRFGFEVDLNEAVGLDLSFTYGRSFKNSYQEDRNTKRSFDSQAEIDKINLRNLGHKIVGADMASLNFGLIIRFF